MRRRVRHAVATPRCPRCHVEHGRGSASGRQCPARALRSLTDAGAEAQLLRCQSSVPSGRRPAARGLVRHAGGKRTCNCTCTCNCNRRLGMPRIAHTVLSRGPTFDELFRSCGHRKQPEPGAALQWGRLLEGVHVPLACWLAIAAAAGRSGSDSRCDVTTHDAPARGNCTLKLGKACNGVGPGFQIPSAKRQAGSSACRDTACARARLAVA